MTWTLAGVSSLLLRFLLQPFNFTIVVFLHQDVIEGLRESITDLLLFPMENHVNVLVLSPVYIALVVQVYFNSGVFNLTEGS